MERKKNTERRISIGLATNNEYSKQVLKACSNLPELMEAEESKTLIGWLVDYFREYKTVVGKDCQSWVLKQFEKNNTRKESAELIEFLLEGLNDEYIEDQELQGSPKYLLDETIDYLRRRQAEILIEKQQQAIESGDMEEFQRLRTEFKPIHKDITDEDKLDIEDLYTKEMEPVDWLIDDLLPKGLTVFGGASKTGKSYLMLHIALHLAQGKILFADDSSTTYIGERGSILYLSLEDPARRIQTRLKAIDPSPKMHFLKRYFDIRCQWSPLYKGGLEEMEQWLEKKKKPILIVVDILEKFSGKKLNTGAHRGYSEDYNQLLPLADLAHKHDIAVIVLTHTTKGKDQDRFNQILGSMGTQGVSDNLMLLERTSESDERLLSIRGKDMEEISLSFKVSREGAQWECLGNYIERQKTTERQSIYDYLLENGGMLYKDIEQAVKDRIIDVSPRSINTILRKMVREGELSQEKTRGKYFVSGQSNIVI